MEGEEEEEQEHTECPSALISLHVYDLPPGIRW